MFSCWYRFIFSINGVKVMRRWGKRKTREKEIQNNSSIFSQLKWSDHTWLFPYNQPPPQGTFPPTVWNPSAEIKALRTSSIGNARLAAVQPSRDRRKWAPERDCHGAFSMTPMCSITLRATLTTSSCTHGRVTSTRASYVTRKSAGMFLRLLFRAAGCSLFVL